MSSNIFSLVVASIENIKRALRGIGHIAQNMSIHHSRLNMLMSEKALNLSDVYACLKQMRGKTMSERMDRGIAETQAKYARNFAPVHENP